MTFDWAISGCSSLDCTLGISDACLEVVFIWVFDMLDYWWLNLIALLSVLILILAWLFWSLHMHTLTNAYHSAWHVDSLTCILFWSSSSRMFVPLFVLIVVFSLILCVHEWYILLCLTVWRVTAFLLHDCMLPVYVGRTYIPFPPTLLVSVIP